jgi:hypothetical protein
VDGVRSGPGEARTILLLHIISVRPSEQPLMVRTFLKVYMELGSYFLFLQEQIKDIIIISTGQCGGSTRLRTGSTCSNAGLVVYVPQASGHGDTWPVVSTEGSAVRLRTPLHCVPLR